MIIKLFNNKIFVPNKCGTRYLQKYYKFKEFEHMFLPNIKNETYFIVRKPIEQLKSALHTELLQYRNMENFDKRFINFLSKNGTVHYSNYLYKSIFLYKQKNEKCKIINIDELNALIEKLGNTPKYDKKNYDFSNEVENWVDKNEFYEYLKIRWPKEISILENWSYIENEYYEKLLSNNIEKLPINLI